MYSKHKSQIYHLSESLNNYKCKVFLTKFEIFLTKKTHFNIIVFSFPTLNVSVPEEVLEDPRLLFHLDPIIGEKHVGKV